MYALLLVGVWMYTLLLRTHIECSKVSYIYHMLLYYYYCYVNSNSILQHI